LNLDYDDCFFHGSCALHQIQAHVEKRLSHGLQVGFSYTFSHSTDEQSGMGLFYNGSNPLNLRSGYGLSDFDRKHVTPASATSCAKLGKSGPTSVW